MVWKQPLFTVITSDDGENYSENFGIGTPICEAKGLDITSQFDGNGYVQHTLFGERCSGGSAFTYVYDGPFSVFGSDTSYFGNGGGYTGIDVNPNTGTLILGHEDGNLLRRSTIFNDADTLFLDTTGVAAMAYAGGNIWFAATSDLYNSMYKSLDDGLTFAVDPSWFPSFFYPQFRAMEFLESGLGLAGAESNQNYGAIVVHTAIGWSFYYAEEPINTVAILENGTAYAAGENGLLMRSAEPITLDVKSDETDHSILLYPNPANTLIYIANKGNSIIKEIAILDHSGRVLKTYPPESKTLDLSAFSPALYLVKIITEKEQVVKKIVVY